MKRLTKSFAGRIGDGGLLDGFFDQLPEGFFADLFADLLMSWLGGCSPVSDGAEAKKQAEEAWNPSARRGRGGYDFETFRRAVASVHVGAKRLGRRMHAKAKRTAARQFLDGIRNGDPSEMTEVIRENE